MSSLGATTVSGYISGSETNSFGNVTPTAAQFSHTTASSAAPLQDGTGTGQANHAVSLLVAAGTGGVTFDLTATGAQTGFDGKNRDFSNANSGGKVKGILIENMDPTNTITVSLPGSNGWTGFSGEATAFSKVIQPGGFLQIYDPVGIAVSTTNKQFVLTSNAGTPNAKITIVGRAA